MTRATHSRFVVVLLVVLAAMLAFGAPASAQSAAVQAGPSVTAEADTTDEQVTDLPTTGRGHQAPPVETQHLAIGQTLTTVVVLLAAAALALGGIGVLWRYERR